jgi:hypothetical protein
VTPPVAVLDLETMSARTVNMKLHPQDLQKIARLTLEHYNQRAEEFWEGTRDHNGGIDGYHRTGRN